MAKNVEFKDYEVEYDDPDGDPQTSNIRAHVANKDTADQLGTVQTRTGAHSVRDGDVLIETDRQGVYDIHDRDTWEKTGYSESGVKKMSAPVDSPPDDLPKSDDEEVKSSSAESDNTKDTAATNPSPTGPGTTRKK